MAKIKKEDNRSKKLQEKQKEGNETCLLLQYLLIKKLLMFLKQEVWGCGNKLSRFRGTSKYLRHTTEDIEDAQMVRLNTDFNNIVLNAYE